MASGTVIDQQEWLQTLAELTQEIEQWCRSRVWQVEPSTKSLHESKLGDYDAPVLMIHAPQGIVYIEPVARFVSTGNGLVDLYAWPSLRRLLLVRKGSKWVLRTDSGVPWHRPWNEQTFTEIVAALHEPV